VKTYRYALDRGLKALMYKVAVTTIEHADAPLTAAGTRFLPDSPNTRPPPSRSASSRSGCRCIQEPSLVIFNVFGDEDRRAYAAILHFTGT